MATSNLDLILPLQCHVYHTMDKHLLLLSQLRLFLARLPFPETTMSVQSYTCPTKPLADPNSSPVHRAGVPADQAAYSGRDKRALDFVFSQRPWALLNQALPPRQQQIPVNADGRKNRHSKGLFLLQVLDVKLGWGILHLLARLGRRYPNQMIFSLYTSLLCLPQAYVTHTFTFSLQW